MNKQKQDLVNVQAPRIPYDNRLKEKYDIDAGEWRVLVEAIFPNAETFEAVTMALAYCKSRKLDIMKRPVHIVPMWNSAKKANVETVWPSIAEIRTTAARTGAYAGKDAPKFGPMKNEVFSGEVWKGPKGNRHKEPANISVDFPEWCELTVYRMVQGSRFSFTEIIFWKEAYGKQGGSDLPNEMWRKRSMGQLNKCAEAAALRAAFPEEIGNDYAAEEMAGKAIDMNAAPQADSEAPARPQPADFKEAVEFSELHDEFGNKIAEHATPEFVDEIVERIETFKDRKTLDDFMANNKDEIENLGTRSNERKDIAETFNTACENFRTTLSDEEKWFEWCAEFTKLIVQTVDESGLNTLLGFKKSDFEKLEKEHPIWHAELLKGINERQAALSGTDKKE